MLLILQQEVQPACQHSAPTICEVFALERLVDWRNLRLGVAPANAPANGLIKQNHK